MKPKSLFPILTEAQLIKLMTKKQKALIEKLKKEGTPFRIRNINQRPYIMIAKSNYYGYTDDYDEPDYEYGIDDTQREGSSFWNF